MSDPTIPATESNATDFSRRSLLGGLAFGAGAIGLVGAATSGRAAAAPGDQTEALDPTVAGLVYLPLDAFAFDTAGTAAPTTQRRLYQEITGMQPLTPPDRVRASLPIPIGSVVRQINVSYQGQPIISIDRRNFADGVFAPVTALLSTAAGGGVKTQSFSTNVELTAGGSYAMEVFCSAGDSILGMTVGYVPPAQAFIPYTGTLPRVLDTRDAGQTKFAANEERVIDLSSRLIATARAAVINLTADATGGGGFLSAYADGIAWPGNSTVNFSGANQTVANAAVVTMVNGRIKVRSGVNGSHVIVDVVGSLL